MQDSSRGAFLNLVIFPGAVDFGFLGRGFFFALIWAVLVFCF